MPTATERTYAYDRIDARPYARPGPPGLPLALHADASAGANLVAQPKGLVIGLGLVLVVAALSLAVSLYVLTLLGRQPAPSSKPDTTTWYARHLMQVGIASWYGPRFHGRKTANGEVFNQNKLTAAHRKHRLGTMVQVTNVKNGMSVEVRINDRGPYAKGRVIDVSRAAAERLGMKDAGLARVQIRTIHSLIR